MAERIIYSYREFDNPEGKLLFTDNETLISGKLIILFILQKKPL